MAGNESLKWCRRIRLPCAEVQLQLPPQAGFGTADDCLDKLPRQCGSAVGNQRFRSRATIFAPY